MLSTTIPGNAGQKWRSAHPIRQQPPPPQHAPPINLDLINTLSAEQLLTSPETKTVLTEEHTMSPKRTPQDQIAHLEARINSLTAQRAELVADFPTSTTTTKPTISPSTPHPISHTPILLLPAVFHNASTAAHSTPLPLHHHLHASRQSNVDADADAAAAPVLKTANATMQRHIKLLQDYNAVKDVAMGMMGLIAERKGLRVGDVMEELGVEGRGE